jgi:DHA2 family methylenomycin A resistance protein-like MFS transporter
VITLGRSTPYEVLEFALTLLVVAGGTIIPAITSAVVSSVPAAHVGVASSALTAARQTGAVLGTAVLGGLLSRTNFVSDPPLTMGLCALALASVALVGVRMRAPRAERQRVGAGAQPSTVNTAPALKLDPLVAK